MNRVNNSARRQRIADQCHRRWIVSVALAHQHLIQGVVWFAVSDDNHGVDFDLRFRGVEQVFERSAFAIKTNEIGSGMNGNIGPLKRLINVRELIGHECPSRSVACWRGVGDLSVLPR